MSVLATLYHGTLPLITSGPDEGDSPFGTLDALDWEILCTHATWRTDLLALGLGRGLKIPEYHNMWVQSAIPTRQDSLNTLVKVAAIGTLYDTQKRLRQIGSAVQQISLGPEEGRSWNANGVECARWTIRDRILTVRDIYFVDELPSTSVIGTAITPPSAPDAPPFIWGDLSLTWRANHPSGWVLDDRQMQQHFYHPTTGEGLWEVTDSFGFYQIASPE